jgi:release factor glutamine methyltransferase
MTIPSVAEVIAGKHRLKMVFRDGVAPATAYSLLLAEHIPDLRGQVVVDLGTGSGLFAIISLLQGARKVYLLDTYDKAIILALENGERNGVGHGMVHLPLGSSMVPLPVGERVDVILSNPAQLPLPERESENSPFYAGPEGRAMIDQLIQEAPDKLNSSGRLLMTHNSLANLGKSFDQFAAVGMTARIVAEREIAFRPFIDRAWIDSLGGVEAGLYFLKDGVAHERLCVIEATPAVLRDSKPK